MTIDANLPYVQFVHAFYDVNKDKVFEGSFKYNGTMIKNVGSHARSLYMKDHPNEIKTDKQASNAIRKLCGKLRETIIRQNAGKRKVGELSTMSDQVNNEKNEKWKPINNPIASKKMKEANFEKNRESIANNPNITTAQLTKVEANALADKILDTVDARFHPDLSPRKALHANAGTRRRSVYTGMTKTDCEKSGEPTRFLTERGANTGNIGQRNRPVLRNKDDSVMRKADIERCGFKYIIVFRSKLRVNCSMVEDAIQTKIGDMRVPLGVQLHRWVAMGSNQLDQDYDHPDYLCKVFLTFAPYELIKLHCKVIA